MLNFTLNRHRAVTLVEIIVSISVISIMIGLVLSAIQSARQTSSKLVCVNNFRQIGIALSSYESAHGFFPAMASKKQSNPSAPESILSWMVLILPYLDQDDLYRSSVQACFSNQYALAVPPHNGFVTPIKIYVCGNDQRLLSVQTDELHLSAAFTSYIGVAGALDNVKNRVVPGILGNSFGTKATDVVDGLTNTLFVGERPPPNSLQAGWWYPIYYGDGRNFRGPNIIMFAGDNNSSIRDPNCSRSKVTFGPGFLNNPCDRFHFWSLHAGGANWLLGDGSVKYFPYSSENIISAMATKAGGEIIP